MGPSCSICLLVVHEFWSCHVFVCPVCMSSCVCVGSIAPLTCWAHMAGRLDCPRTVHDVVIWQLPFSSLHTPAWMMWHLTCGVAWVFVYECLTAICFYVCVWVCVCAVMEHPACGNIPCQECVCLWSRHMDVDTVTSQHGSGCCYLLIASWTTADATSAQTGRLEEERQKKKKSGITHLLDWSANNLKYF